MSLIKFSKFHGFGNDYIVIEKSSVPETIDLGNLAKRVCHRHTGAGADGIALIGRPQTSAADFYCEIINPDGSIAGFSGNGTRCAVSYLYRNNLWDMPVLRLETRTGVKKYMLLESSGGRFVFEAEIGMPRFASSEIPYAGGAASDDVIDREIVFGNDTYRVSCVNVGNPVACIFVDDFDFDWRAAGRGLEIHASFPQRANIVFVLVHGRGTIEINIWERGAGETAASGTCSAGAAVLGAYTGKTRRRVNVISEGGVTVVDWRGDDEIVITGSADFVYSGEWPLAAA